MDRRAFIGTLTGGLLASPLAADAQQPRVYRIGVVLQGGPYLGAVDGLRRGLAELGLLEAKIGQSRMTIRTTTKRPPIPPV